MTNDFFDDITPESGTPIRYTREVPDVTVHPKAASSGKSIRNVSPPPRPRGRATPPQPPAALRGEMEPLPPRRRGASRVLLWTAASLSVLVLLGLTLLALRDTKISITPRTQPIVFDPSVLFTAFPAESATGTLSYTVKETDIEDSTVVPAQGTERVDEKAVGNITVYNEYSADSVRLIKNTRFETPDGLIFRIPESVVIPGRRGTVPGQVTVTVFADQTGEKYNIGPVEKFTLPGLKSTPDMYAGVYARSTAPMSGGFSGERPAVAPGALEAARAEVRGRLEQKALEAAQAASNKDSVVVPSLVHITYRSLPPTPDAGGGLRIREQAHLVIPVFSSEAFAATVAAVATADASGSLRLLGRDGFGASISPEEATKIGTGAFSFGLQGTGTLVWQVDEAGLKEALAGRSKDAFEAIVASIPSIDTASARVSPFWKRTFPSDPQDIVVFVAYPEEY